VEKKYKSTFQEYYDDRYSPKVLLRLLIMSTLLIIINGGLRLKLQYLIYNISIVTITSYVIMFMFVSLIYYAKKRMNHEI
jgi:sterol desaturase/sphingolipid hydroxylase (fatty acid hydroxylase superfamily)